MRSAVRRFGSGTEWGRKRFYKNTSIYREGSGYGVHLDFRALRTPLRKLFIVPREQLAVGVAQEWAGQSDVMVPSHMHLPWIYAPMLPQLILASYPHQNNKSWLMRSKTSSSPDTSLCNTVIDDVNDKQLNTESLQQYLEDDTLCFHATEPDELISLQQLHWTPIIQWFNHKFSANVEPSNGLVDNSCSSSSKLDSNVALSAVNKWSTVGIQQMIELTGSLMLTMALLMERISVTQASWLSRLETEFQINCWGSVEWYHEVDRMHLNAALSASLLFTQLTTDC